MIPALIWALATLDAAFVGFRDSAGRNPHLHKRAFYWGGVLRGLWIGQLVIVAAGAAIVAAHAFGSNSTAVWAAHQQAAIDMATVYSPFALLVISAILIHILPSPDISSLATVLVLGPFTALRPLVIIAGGVFTIVRRGPGPATSSVLVACTLMLLLHWLMALKWKHYNPVEDR